MSALEPKSKDISNNVTEKLTDFFREKITDKISDKNQARELLKDSWSDPDIKLKRGSRGLAEKAFERVMGEKGYSVPDGTFKNTAKSSGNVEGVVAEFAENTKKIVNDALGNNNSNQQTQQQSQDKGFGIFQKNNNSQISNQQSSSSIISQELQKERKLISLEDQKKMMRSMFDFPKKMFYKFDLVDGEKPPKEIPQTFSEEVDMFADNLAVYCYENDMHMPTWIEGLGIALAGLMLFGAPILMKIMSAKKDNNKKEKSNKISGHSIAEQLAKQERNKVVGAA